MLIVPHLQVWCQTIRQPSALLPLAACILHNYIACRLQIRKTYRRYFLLRQKVWRANWRVALLLLLNKFVTFLFPSLVGRV